MATGRNPLKVVLLTILTLGIYGLYWFYTTSRAVIHASGRDSHPALWLLGLFLPLIDFIVLWRFSSTVEEVSGGHSRLLTFVLWPVFFPAAQYLVQKDVNEAAGDASNPLPP